MMRAWYKNESKRCILRLGRAEHYFLSSLGFCTLILRFLLPLILCVQNPHLDHPNFSTTPHNVRSPSRQARHRHRRLTRYFPPLPISPPTTQDTHTPPQASARPSPKPWPPAAQTSSWPTPRPAQQHSRPSSPRTSLRSTRSAPCLFGPTWAHLPVPPS